MEIKNFFKLEFTVFSKNYQEDDSKKYKGKALYIIRKEDKKIVFRTLKLDEDQTIIESANYEDKHQSNSYISAQNLASLKEYRLEAFDCIAKDRGSKKPLVSFKGDIKYLNDLILKAKATPKDVVGFLSGSNAAGELKKSKAAELIAKFDDNELVELFGKENFITTDNLSWRIIGLLDNCSEMQRNASFTNEVTWEDLEGIEAVTFKEIFGWGWKVVPWSKTLFEEDYVNFDEAIASQNIDLFNDGYDRVDAMLFDEEYFEQGLYDKIFDAIDKSNRNALRNILRATWAVNVNKDIEAKKYNTDFVKGLSRFERCHIVEQHDAISKLMDNSIDKDLKIEYLDKLLNKENYLLLEQTLHDYWDKSKCLIINRYGDIINNGLPLKDFEKIVGKYKNIYSIYEDSMSGDRESLFSFRGE